jgi:hypothetical protein
MAREIATRILATAAALADNLEHEITIGAANDNKVYHVKGITCVTEMDTGATDMAFVITDADDLVVWASTSLTAIGQTGPFSLTASAGIAAGFTDGDGNEHIVLPDKMVIPGGWKIKTLTATVANADHGIMTVFGAVFKAY